MDVIERNTMLQAELIEELLAGFGRRRGGGHASSDSRDRAPPAPRRREPPRACGDRLRDADDGQLALAAGYQRDLAKPVEPASLIAAVAELAGKRN
jgi:hypothetical protein